ncbi:uncharacterized protein LOC129612739, partial [Condylostylus longicornis]|uniref:uncharacterized protein LOC129612739 n=1 Tax=Condylostylus longicornis TaxID=2530218 RepID=UPI00244DABA9
ISFIENFLSELNININTELILAKRYQKSIIDGNNNNNDNNEKGEINSNHMDYYQLFDVWNPGHFYGGKLNITKIGIFSNDHGLILKKWYRSQSTVIRRMNMQNVPIRCMIVTTKNVENQSLVQYLENRTNAHLDSMHHFSFALLSHVSDIFNFKLNLTTTNSWGYLINGTYDGMIGALIRNETDIGGSPIFYRLERAKVIHYTLHKTWISRNCFIFRHPKTSNLKGIVFLQPFEKNVWISISLCCLIIILIETSYNTQNENYKKNIGKLETKFLPHIKQQYHHKQQEQQHQQQQQFRPKIIGIQDRTNCRQYHKQKIINKKCSILSWSNWISYKNQCLRKSKNEKFLKINIFDFIVFVIGMLCLQGVSINTKLLSGRIIIFSTLLFSFLIFQYYSASIVGSLLIESPKTIRTLRDLIKSDLNLGIEDIVYNKDFFRRTTDPDAIELYNKFTRHQAKSNKKSMWLTPEIGMRLVKLGGYAFHVDVSAAYKIISEIFTEKEICELSEIQLFPSQKMVNIVQKGSPLRKVIMYGLRRTYESGLMDYQRKIWSFRKPHCTKKIEQSDLSVDMQTFLSAFFILLFGFASSLIILIFEILFNLFYIRSTTTIITK